MKNTNLFSADSMSAKLAPVFSYQYFGTRFAKNPSHNYLIIKCDEQIAICKRWLANLEQLKKEQQKYQALAKKDEIKYYLSFLSEDEIQDIRASKFVEDAVILEE